MASSRRRYVATPDGVVHFHDFRTTYADGLGMAMCGADGNLTSPLPGATFCDLCKQVDEHRRTQDQYSNLYTYYDEV